MSATNLRSTSVAVCGHTAEILGAMSTRDRGIYVSHLVDTRPMPEAETRRRSEEVVPLRLRLTDTAHATLAKSPNASRLVDAYVQAAWADTVEAVRVVRECEIGGSQMAALWRLAHLLRPSNHHTLFLAAEFAQCEKEYGVRASSTEILGTSNVGTDILRLRELVPLDAALVLSEANEAVERERRAQRDRNRAASKT